MEPEKKEVLRYLGYHGSAPDPQVDWLVDNCIGEILACAEPRQLDTVLSVERQPGDIVNIGPMRIRSKGLSKNLSGCSAAAIFAATLGVGVDTLLRRTAKLDMAKAVVLQAAAAAAVECFCNDCQRRLAAQYAEHGQFLRPRFSPGYGDFSIAHQAEILAILQAQKKIGLMLTDALMMVPQKSVTAIIGIGDHDLACKPGGCDACGKLDCAFRLTDH
ncbi:MAG: vitamin B12 dependent-methionine synthase activation domain-containing protein [Angelakisella sp.]